MLRIKKGGRFMYFDDGKYCVVLNYNRINHIKVHLVIKTH